MWELPVFHLLALALFQQHIERTTAAVATFGAVDGHDGGQLRQPSADIAFQQGARGAALPLAVQDQQAADIPGFTIRNELHQRLARFVEGFLVQVQARLQLVFAKPQLLVDPLLYAIAFEADDLVRIAQLDRLHGEVVEGELLGGGSLAAGELRLGRSGFGRLGMDVVAANGPHVGHFVQK